MEEKWIWRGLCSEGWERERKQKAEMENSVSSITALVGTGAAGKKRQRESGRRELFLLDSPRNRLFFGSKTAWL